MFHNDVTNELKRFSEICESFLKGANDLKISWFSEEWDIKIQDFKKACAAWQKDISRFVMPDNRNAQKVQAPDFGQFYELERTMHVLYNNWFQIMDKFKVAYGKYIQMDMAQKKYHEVCSESMTNLRLKNQALMIHLAELQERLEKNNESLRNYMEEKGKAKEKDATIERLEQKVDQLTVERANGVTLLAGIAQVINEETMTDAQKIENLRMLLKSMPSPVMVPSLAPPAPRLGSSPLHLMKAPAKAAPTLSSAPQRLFTAQQRQAIVEPISAPSLH